MCANTIHQLFSQRRNIFVNFLSHVVPPPAAPKAAAPTPAKPKPSVPKQEGDGYIDTEVTSMRRTIAKRLTESKVSRNTFLSCTLFSFNPAFNPHGIVNLYSGNVHYSLNLGLLFWLTLFVVFMSFSMLCRQQSSRSGRKPQNLKTKMS